MLLINRMIFTTASFLCEMLQIHLETWKNKIESMIAPVMTVCGYIDGHSLRAYFVRKFVWTQDQHTLIENDHLGDQSPEKE